MSNKIKAVVVLSGTGVLDGTEIGEAILSLTSLSKYDVEYHCFAPSIEFNVVNPISGEESGEKRNALIEASRISRGSIQELKNANANDFDMLIIPGGFGVAKTLSNIAFSDDIVVLPELKSLIVEFFNLSKPIGCICISPLVVVTALKDLSKISVTIGDDESKITQCGGLPVLKKSSEDFVFDSKNKIFSCSAYMSSDATLYKVSKGIDSMINSMVLEVSK